MSERGSVPRSRAEPDAPLDGTLIADTYRLTARLGGGGMGEVFEAEHVRLGCLVAIKFMRGNADQAATARFRREARRMSAIRSAHVVRVFDHGQLPEGTPYLVMERLFGEDLRRLLKREETLPVRRAIRLVTDACRGLSAAHEAGFVHRDLKPANLFVERDADSSELCKILDFGVARGLEDTTTSTAGLVGTVRYMAPEQLENAASATRRADVYALGAVLYECLTGVPAHAGASLEETMFDIVHRDVRPPSVHRPLPADLDAVLLRALTRDPSARFGSMHEFARALAPFGPLEPVRVELSNGEEDTLGPSNRPSSRPHRGGEAARMLVVALAAAAAGVALGHGFTRTEARPASPSLQAVVPARIDARAAPTPNISVPTPALPSVGQPPSNAAASAASTAMRLTRQRAPRPAPAALQQLHARAPAAIAERFDPTDPYD